LTSRASIPSMPPSGGVIASAAPVLSGIV
jgi:hypothetical protein